MLLIIISLLISIGEAETKAEKSTNYFAFVNYSPLDLIVPSKYGVTMGLIQSSDETWEFEYLRGNLSFALLVDDLGAMTDQRFSITRRSYWSKNMYVGYGLSYFDFSARLGSDLLDSVGANVPSVDLIELQSLGAHFALGTMWTFKHDLALSVEWIAWAQPIFQLKKDAPFLSESNDSGDRDTVRKALNFISYFPHFSVLKIQFGMLF